MSAIPKRQVLADVRFALIFGGFIIFVSEFAVWALSFLIPRSSMSSPSPAAWVFVMPFALAFFGPLRSDPELQSKFWLALISWFVFVAVSACGLVVAERNYLLGCLIQFLGFSLAAYLALPAYRAIESASERLRRKECERDALEPQEQLVKYAPLRTLLESQQANKVKLSFKDIEAIVGELPPSAKKWSGWWSDPQTGPMEAWEPLGYHARHSVGAKHVIFSKGRPKFPV